MCALMSRWCLMDVRVASRRREAASSNNKSYKLSFAFGRARRAGRKLWRWDVQCPMSNVQRFHNDFNSLSYRSLAIYNIPKYSAQVASVA